MEFDSEARKLCRIIQEKKGTTVGVGVGMKAMTGCSGSNGT